MKNLFLIVLLIFAALKSNAQTKHNLEQRQFSRLEGNDQLFVLPQGANGIFTVKNGKNIQLKAPEAGVSQISKNRQGSTFMVFGVEGFVLDGRTHKNEGYGIEIKDVNLRMVDYTNNIQIRNVKFLGDYKTMSAISVKTDPTPQNLKRGKEAYKKWELESFVAENLIFTKHGNEAIYLGTTQTPWHQVGRASVNNCFVSESGREFMQFGHVQHLELDHLTLTKSGIYKHGDFQENGIQIGDSRGWLKNSIIDQSREYGILLATCGFTIENVFVNASDKSPIIILKDSRIQHMKNQDGSFDPIVIEKLYVKNVDKNRAVVETATDKVPIIIKELYIDGDNPVFLGVNGAKGTSVKVGKVIRKKLPDFVLDGYDVQGDFFEGIGFRYAK